MARARGGLLRPRAAHQRAHGVGGGVPVPARRRGADLGGAHARGAPPRRPPPRRDGPRRRAPVGVLDRPDDRPPPLRPDAGPRAAAAGRGHLRLPSPRGVPGPGDGGGGGAPRSARARLRRRPGAPARLHRAPLGALPGAARPRHPARPRGRPVRLPRHLPRRLPGERGPARDRAALGPAGRGARAGARLLRSLQDRDRTGGERLRGAGRGLRERARRARRPDRRTRARGDGYGRHQRSLHPPVARGHARRAQRDHGLPRGLDRRALRGAAAQQLLRGAGGLRRRSQDRRSAPPGRPAGDAPGPPAAVQRPLPRRPQRRDQGPPGVLPRLAPRLAARPLGALGPRRGGARLRGGPGLRARAHLRGVQRQAAPRRRRGLRPPGRGDVRRRAPRRAAGALARAPPRPGRRLGALRRRADHRLPLRRRRARLRRHRARQPEPPDRALAEPRPALRPPRRAGQDPVEPSLRRPASTGRGAHGRGAASLRAGGVPPHPRRRRRGSHPDPRRAGRGVRAARRQRGDDHARPGPRAADPRVGALGVLPELGERRRCPGLPGDADLPAHVRARSDAPDALRARPTGVGGGPPDGAGPRRAGHAGVVAGSGDRRGLFRRHRAG